MQLLLDKGADVDAQSEWFPTALQLASLHGYDKMVQILLNWGADVNTRGGDYATALQLGSLKGHEKIVDLLTDKNACS